jgi:putative nucleotidyltransferase with HDIG domain
MALASGEQFRNLWRERFRWLWPYYLAYGVVSFALVIGYEANDILGVLAVVVPLMILRFSQVQYLDHTKDIVKQLRQQNTVLEEHAEEITSLNEELLLALAHMVDLRDPFVYGHSQHVSRYATCIAQEMGLDGECLELIRKAGLLHDVGKMGISEQILFKPGPLTHEEYEIVKTHSILGAQIIDSVHSLRTLTPIVRHHHERFDGRGYPDGLSGQNIPLEARIMCLSDALEAMASDRPYRKALTYEEILNEITVHAGTQFDPVVVEAFMEVLKREGREVLVNSAVLTKEREPALMDQIQFEEKIKVPGD